MANISFGERARRGRIKNGWSQAELAEKLDVTQATICNWEIGKIVPKPHQKTRLREVLGFDKTDSISDKEEVTVALPLIGMGGFDSAPIKAANKALIELSTIGITISSWECGVFSAAPRMEGSVSSSRHA